MCKEDIYSPLHETNMDDSDEGSNDEDNYSRFDLGDIDNVMNNVEFAHHKELGNKVEQSDDLTHCSYYMIDYFLYK